MTPMQPIRWLAGSADVRTAIDHLRASGSPPERLHTGPHRRIEAWPAVGPETPSVVLKWYAPRRPALRQGRDRLLTRTADLREWRALRALSAAGLPVPRPLARGRTGQGERVVAMEHTGEVPLLEGLQHASPAERHALLRSVAKTVGRLHAAGFVHGDLHLGNLRATGDTIHLIDLGRTRRTRSRRARDADLARLLHSVERDARDSEAASELREAIGGGARLDDARRAFLADHARGRARRFLRAGASWQRLASAPDWTGLGTHRIAPDVLADALLHWQALRREAPRRDGRVTIEHLEQEGEERVRKHVVAGSLRRQVADRGRGSPARRAFLNSERDRLISDRAAPALAYLERRSVGRVEESLLLLETVGDHDLDAYHPTSAEEGRRIAFALMDWLAEQHAVGLGHRDAKGGNLRLGLGLEHEERPRFWWVDLEDLLGPVRLTESARLHTLVQLNASLADEAFDARTRREALARYHARLPFTRPLPQIEREIHTRSLARRHRYRGEGPPVSRCSP